jgi:hypothetical protein
MALRLWSGNAHDPELACAKRHYVIGDGVIATPGMPENPMR